MRYGFSPLMELSYRKGGWSSLFASCFLPTFTLSFNGLRLSVQLKRSPSCGIIGLPQNIIMEGKPTRRDK